MRRIVHLSDLHFGRARPELLEPLLRSVNAAAPDLVAISGDMTQRARIRQFAEARDFLDRIEAPVLVVPGNHDTPLDNLAVRLLRPWTRWRRHIGRDLEPAWEDEEVVVVGLNTVDPLAWQRGWIKKGDLGRVRRAFGPRGAGRVRIVVAHHPLVHRPGEEKALMRGARRALRSLADCGTDVVLTGHLHSWSAEPHVEDGSGGVLLVAAGTGLSTRLRGEENDFNLLSLAPDEIVVERFAAEAAATGFERVLVSRFRRGASGWARRG